MSSGIRNDKIKEVDDEGVNQKDQYEVTIPLSKDQFVSRVKEGTYELNVQNQSYRKSYLANIREDDRQTGFDGSKSNQAD